MRIEKKDFKIGGIYLIRKVGAGSENIFIDKKDYSRFLLGLEFYNSSDTINLWKLFFCQQKVKKEYNSEANTLIADKIDFFEDFKKSLWEKRIENSKNHKRRKRIVSILGFALLPRSYYLLVLEIEKNGISRFMHKMGGYSSYFNRRHKRKGVLFRSQYECWHIRDKAHAIKVLNALHIRPIEVLIRKESAFSHKDKGIRKEELFDELCKYRYSSFLDYTGRWNFASVTKRGFLLDYLRGKENYKKQAKEYLEERIDMAK